MKPKKHLLFAVVTAAFSISANAATFFWDGTAANIAAVGNAISDPSAAGVWNTTTLNWDQSTSGLAHVAWANSLLDTAVFAGTARTVTSSGTLNVGKLDIRTNQYVFTGGTLNFSGGTIDVNGTNVTGAAQGLISNLSGSVVMNATGSTLTTTTFISAIAGNNTGLTSFELNANQSSNQLGVFNAGAVGSNGSTLKLTKGIFALSAAALTTYNSWATELAGGVIRLRVAGDSTYSGNSTLSTNSALATANLAANLIYTGTINLNSNTLSLAPGSATSNININNTISGTGNITTTGDVVNFGSSGIGTTTLGVANTFSGIATTAQNFGTLALKHVNALQNATLDTGATGTQAVTFTVAGTNTYNIGALQGSDVLAIGGNTISVGSKAVDTTFGAAINGTGGVITKVGDNTLTLSATSGYTGATNVNDGTLLINGNITTSSLTTVASGATLGGTGTVSVVTVLGGGTLAPGTAAGTLSSGTVSLADMSNLNFELNPADITVGGGINDLLSVTGNLTLDGILNLTATSGDFLSVVSGTAWRLFNYSGSLTDNIVNLGTLPALASGLSWNIDTATANQVNLVVIPEPAAALLGGLGLLALLRRRR